MTNPTPMPIRKLLLATTNLKKLVEMQRLMGSLDIELYTLQDVPTGPEVEETGSTFLENARIKAIAQATRLNMWAVGEDSGLCVPALQGAPGVYSARFAGPNASDEDNNSLLLEKMQQLEGEDRSAYYISTIALSNPEGQIQLEASGTCQGIVLRKRKGQGGFGYDPLFLVREYHRTFAELGPAVKSCISHRARSLGIFLTAFRRLLAHQDPPTV